MQVSVTGSARRAQIVAATIETIAELGYGQASFARIAERAGLSSTRLISYHFAGKDDLIGAVMAQVYGEMGEFMADFMAQCLGDAGEPTDEGTADSLGLVESASATEGAVGSPGLVESASAAEGTSPAGAAGSMSGAVEAGGVESPGAGAGGEAPAPGDAERSGGGAAGESRASRDAAAAGVGGGRRVRARFLLRGYIGGVVAFIAKHPVEMRALMSVFLDYRAESGDRSYNAADEERTLGRLQQILRDGQDNGEFREFDTFVMAATIQRAVDGIPFLLQSRPDLDLVAYGGELITLFDRATVL